MSHSQLTFLGAILTHLNEFNKGNIMTTIEKDSTKDMLKNKVLHICEQLENGFNDELNSDDEQFSAYDYLQDVLDINWILNSDKSVKGARLLVAFGGPNIWIDTNLEQVEGYWWGEKFIAQYRTSEFSKELDYALEDIFHC
jgi:hypothetical protein